MFVGDSITDFWLLGDDPWIPGRMHGRRVWDESFGDAVPQNLALNIGIPGDRTEHLLQSILPTSEPARDDEVVRPVNLRLAALASSSEFAGFTTWLDLYPAFVDAQGKQDPRLFVDGLHPSEAGYRVWRDRLVPALASARASVR